MERPMICSGTVFKKASKKLLVSFCLVATLANAAWVSESVSAVGKSKPKSTKAATVKLSKPAAAMLQEIGVFTGTAAQTRQVLTTKWGFPEWWPSVPGRVAGIYVRWSTANADGSLKGAMSMDVLVSSSVTLEQLADSVLPPPNLVRQPRKPSPDQGRTGAMASDIIDFVDNSTGARIELALTNKPVENGKPLATLFFERPIGSAAEVTIPSPTLLQFLPKPTGSTVTKVDLSVQDHTLYFGEQGFQYVARPPAMRLTADLTGVTGSPRTVLGDLPPGFSMSFDQPKYAGAENKLGTSIDVNVFPNGRAILSGTQSFPNGVVFPKL
jgi:hypothetical protein